MWHKTRFTQLLGIQYPIIQGPFGGRFSSAKLLAMVSNLGGLGSFGLNAYSPEEILAVNTEIKALTAKPYALNLWVPLKDDPVDRYTAAEFEGLKKAFSPYFEELNVPLPEMPPLQPEKFELQLEAVLQAQPPVASFIYGIPPQDEVLELKRRGIITIATATTLEEALLIEEAGIDAVVLSGSEAGGHRASFLKSAELSLSKTFSLIPEASAKLQIPLIAAGGIADGKAMLAALQAGASAVQIGTAFLATGESNASPLHKAQLLNQPLETILTKVYTGRLARTLSNNFTKSFENRELPLAPYPIQSHFLSPLWKAAQEQNKLDKIAFYSGQPSSILKHQTAEELFKALVKEASALDSSG